MRVRVIALLKCLLISLTVCAQNSKPLNLLPQPVEVNIKAGEFLLNEQVQLVAEKELINEASKFNKSIEPALGYSLNVIEGTKAKSGILLKKDKQLSSDFGSESYKINIEPKLVTIKVGGEAGAFYAFQTIRQLLPNEVFSRVKLCDVTWSMPCADILDYPRFEWRGYMLDVSRTFCDADYVKHVLDVMADHKMNVFHWHLVDNNGWRIEIKKYPWLTDVGAYRMQPGYPERGDTTRYGGFYTQEQIRDIVDYAKQKHITILPEVDLPGHSCALLYTMPEFTCPNALKVNHIYPFKDFPQRSKPFDEQIGANAVCAGNDDVFPFFEDIVEELIDLFPCEYIHIGGDEVKKQWWEACPKCQKRMKDENLKDTDELQAYFIKRLEKIINQHDRKLIGWDEILEGGITKSSTIMSWRGNKGAINAVSNGQKTVIASNRGYYFQKDQTDNPLHPKKWPGMLTLKESYEYEPIPLTTPKEQMDLVLGIQSALWTPFTNKPDLWDLAVYPRNFALCESAWAQAGNKNWDEFHQRVLNHQKRMAYQGLAYWREKSIKVGGWNTDVLNSKKSLTVDITSYLTQAGKYLVVLDNVSGQNGLEIRSVAFKKNGKQVASDFHYGTTDAQADLDRMYFVDLQSLEPDAKYEMVIDASGMGGNNSNGDIFLFQP
ncbi:MAG: beta-N-acetylhexosaminidase [Carboxylicivirga sp.]|jgi:hexosaminidase|nr:beta-N-acetylhexosaminidase [Carboxylicivirga sp.]